MNKSTVRKSLTGVTLGWVFAATFINPPIETWEAGVTLVLLFTVFLIDLLNFN